MPRREQSSVSKHEKRKQKQNLELIEPQRKPGFRTLQKIVDASYKLIGAQNFQEVSLLDICAEAGISTGAFYRRFSNKEALLQYLHVHSVKQDLEHFARDYTLERWQGKTLEESLKTMVDTMLREGAQTRGFQRAALERTFSDQDFRDREAELHREYARRVYECILHFRDQVQHPDPNAAADFCARMILVVGVQRNQLRGLEPELVAKTNAQLAAELVECCLRYLRSR